MFGHLSLSVKFDYDPISGCRYNKGSGYVACLQKHKWGTKAETVINMTEELADKNLGWNWMFIPVIICLTCVKSDNISGDRFLYWQCDLNKLKCKKS